VKSSPTVESIPKMAIDTEQHEQLQIASALNVASEIAQRYQLSSLQPLIQSCRQLAERDELSVAVIGRFKAGKSSFLNHLLEREVLPVGVVPVTTVVTEIGYGPQEKATVHFVKGDMKVVPLDDVRSFIAENENPGNRKGVSTVAIELPELAQLSALRFVDIPGLESTFAHNTETALNWLPRTGLALVAVSVDPPLSQHDIAVITSLYEYTPKVSLLLTKVDLLNQAEQQEVLAFVREQLKTTFESAPEVFPYSIKAGYEHLKAGIKNELIGTLLADFQGQRSAVLYRKLETVMSECHDYLTLALKSAESIDSEREALKRQVLGEKDVVDDLKAALRLIVQQTAARVRAGVAKRLENHRSELQRTLLAELSLTFPDWSRSLAFALKSYDGWLNRELAEELAAVSAAERKNLLAPLDKLEGQVFRSLQNFRDRLSDQVMRAFGVPLRTTEQEIELSEPHTPDIHIGRVFDRNWELLSPVLPMAVVGPLVQRHFTGRLPYMIEKNLSRLATQWDESIRAAMADLLTEAHRRIDEFAAVISSLISTATHDAPRIREALDRLNSAWQGSENNR
jgi:GTP-binding protein EngB required for normal cell division